LNRLPEIIWTWGAVSDPVVRENPRLRSWNVLRGNEAYAGEPSAILHNKYREWLEVVNEAIRLDGFEKLPKALLRHADQRGDYAIR
jgi:hypothetical protein